LIPIYEMSAKEIEGYIKCFDVNVQTWVIIVRADQIQGALKSTVATSRLLLTSTG